MRRLASLGLILISCFSLATPAGAEPIEQPELPRVVQDTVLQEAGSTALKHIERRLVNGRVVYEVIWQLGGTDIGILVDQDGAVLDKMRRPAVDQLP